MTGKISVRADRGDCFSLNKDGKAFIFISGKILTSNYASGSNLPIALASILDNVNPVLLSTQSAGIHEL